MSLLVPRSIAFVASLDERFNERRQELLQKRIVQQSRLDVGEMPNFLPETAEIRSSDWQVAPRAGRSERATGIRLLERAARAGIVPQP